MKLFKADKRDEDLKDLARIADEKHVEDTEIGKIVKFYSRDYGQKDGINIFSNNDNTVFVVEIPNKNWYQELLPVENHDYDYQLIIYSNKLIFDPTQVYNAIKNQISPGTHIITEKSENYKQLKNLPETSEFFNSGGVEYVTLEVD